jgi:hypothetical protein
MVSAECSGICLVLLNTFSTMWYRRSTVPQHTVVCCSPDAGSLTYESVGTRRFKGGARGSSKACSKHVYVDCRAIHLRSHSQGPASWPTKTQQRTRHHQEMQRTKRQRKSYTTGDLGFSPLREHGQDPLPTCRSNRMLKPPIVMVRLRDIAVRRKSFNGGRSRHIIGVPAFDVVRLTRNTCRRKLNIIAMLMQRYRALLSIRHNAP